MLDALLETIGTLDILASLAAQFDKPSADAIACDAAVVELLALGAHLSLRSFMP